MNQQSPAPEPEFQPDDIFDEPYVQIVSTEEFVEAVEKETKEEDDV